MKKNFFKQWMIITILASFAGIWPKIGAAQEAKKLFSKGTEYLRQGELDEAIAALEEATNLKSDYVAAYNNKGLAYYKKYEETSDPDEMNKAKSAYDTAYQLDENNAEVNNNLGIYYFKQGPSYYVQAEFHYKKVLPSSQAQEKPYHADVYNNLGVIYAKKGNYINAENAYTNAIRIAGISWDDVAIKDLEYTKYTSAYYNRGNLFYNQGNDLKWQAKQSEAIIKFNQAISDYTVTINFYKNAKALEGFPDAYHNAYYNRGLCKYDLGQYNEAILDYEEAIKLNPGFMWAYYAKGFAHFMMDEYDKASQEFAKVLNSELDSYARYGMGVVFAQKGQDEDALNYLNESCDLGNTWACDALTDNYEDLGQLR